MSLFLKSGFFEKALPAVAGGCLLLLGAVYIADARQQAPQRSLPDLTFDPPLGSGEPDRFASVEPGNNLWIYGGECSECSLNALDPRMIPHQYYDSVIVFYSASEKKFPDFPRPANVLLVRDPAAKLSAKLKSSLDWSLVYL